MSILSFNGSSDYVSVPSNATLNVASQVTVEAWVRPASISSEMGIAGTWDDVSGSNRSYLLWLLNGVPSFYVSHAGGDSTAVNATTTLQVGTWYFLAATYDGANLKIYVNGVLQGTTTATGAIHTNAKPFYIGLQNAGGASRYFNGAIADVSVWNIPLSATTIQAGLGQNLTGNETGLAGAWQLNEGTGTTAHDLTANANNGVLGGGIAANQPSWVANPLPTISIQGGSLTGTGVLNANVTNAALVTPGGAGAGVLTITGSYTQTSAGTLDIDLGGLTAGTAYDQLNVDGAVTLDGTLNVDEIDGFAPTNGNSFAILVAGSLSGEFTTTNGLIGAQLLLVANYSADGVTLVCEQPGIDVSPTAGLQTSQAGATATFSVVLDTQPAANVTVGLSSSNPDAGTISTSQLVFTPQDWNIAQSVTVTGVNDFVDEGNLAYTIVMAPAVSADPIYNGFVASNVNVINVGTMHAGFNVTPTTGLQTSQAGATATFIVNLTSKPLADVVFALLSSLLSAGTVSPATLTFTAQNWNIPQTVKITGVNDQRADGNVPYTIINQPAVSSDPKYNKLTPADVLGHQPRHQPARSASGQPGGDAVKPPIRANRHGELGRHQHRQPCRDRLLERLGHGCGHQHRCHPRQRCHGRVQWQHRAR